MTYSRCGLNNRACFLYNMPIDFYFNMCYNVIINYNKISINIDSKEKI